MAELLSPEVRAAQRRVTATVRASGALTGGGLALWREAAAGEWKASAAEIAQDLTLLEVPHQVVRAFRFPLANARSKQLRRGEEVRIAKKDLPHLVRWMPSLKESIDQITDDWPAFAFHIMQPRGGGVVLKTLALSADWPYWTVQQARSAGLLCAECDYDLRQRDDKDRQPYNIPRPERPGRVRLVCGRCATRVGLASSGPEHP